MNIITCNCKHCKGKSARVNGTSKGMSRTLIHNMVCLAHSGIASVKHGPFPI